MRLGVVVANQGATIDGVAEQLVRLEALGVDSAWMPGIPNGPDILTLLAVAGRATQRIELGSAVLPALPRHPAALAVQALAVNEAVGGRFTLGLGVSHQKVMEGHLGLSFERPVATMRDYLGILRPLLADHSVDYTGTTLRTRLWLDVTTTAGTVPGVLVAALGPQMLRLAGRHADGTVTWMTGLSTIEHHVVPGILAAAQEAGRPAPRILAGLPVMLTASGGEAAGRATAAEEFAVYGRLPAYQAMFEREGAAGPGDIALVGDEARLTAELARVRDTGATEFQATPFGDAEAIDRTVEFLASAVSGN
jgi:5,10-methylenetetrahydromethanopterin reductase